MEQTDKEKTYIGILSTSLEKKSRLLDEILKLTEEQGKLLLQPFNEEQFNDLLAAEEKLFQEIQQLDEGFESIYQQVRTALLDKKITYKEEIQQMQHLIKIQMEQSAKIQAIELQNKEKFRLYIQMQRGKIKEFKKNHRSMKSYYDNITGQPKQEAIFFDKKN